MRSLNDMRQSVIAAALVMTFTAAAHADPVLWVAGDQFDAAAANLGTWYDRSSANNHLTLSQGDGAAVVLSTLNGLPVVRTTADSYDTPGAVQFSTVFTVLNNNQGATFPGSNTAIASPDCCPYIVQSTGGGGSTNLDTSFDTPNGTFFINGTASNNFATLSDHKLVTKTLDSQASQTVRVGWDRNIAGRNWDGDFAEIILFEQTLTVDERTGVNAILGAKYGLSVPAATDAQVYSGFAALGNLVADGSFEQNTSASVHQSQASELGPGNYAGSSFGAADVLVHWDKDGGRNWYQTDNGLDQYPDGDFAMRLDGAFNDGIDDFFQDGIFLMAGFTYELEFAMWGEGSASPQIDVALLGPDTITLFDDETTVGNDGSFEVKSIWFTPDVTGSYRLNFVADSPPNGNQHTWIDAVSITVVPAPAALPAGLTILGLIAARRRRRNA